MKSGTEGALLDVCGIEKERATIKSGNNRILANFKLTSLIEGEVDTKRVSASEIDKRNCCALRHLFAEAYRQLQRDEVRASVK
ncbi:MAG: hypothetical protein AMJ41_01300 [candidate division Zixibacteria bacterium DG_27]|nr:MAG: hypothetical protein AMJ41_01300 [candidate division Zixibacteria bacterium DG_27]